MRCSLAFTRTVVAIFAMASFACGTVPVDSTPPSTLGGNSASSAGISNRNVQPIVPAGALSVYRDSIESGWADWSTSLVIDDPANATNPLGGKAVAARFSVGGELRYGHVDTNDNDLPIPDGAFRVLNVYLNPASTPAALAQLEVALDDHAPAAVAYYTSLTADTWVQLQIPLADLGGGPFTSIALLHADGATLYVDAMWLEL